jgi:hypothetical protein
MFFMEAQFEGGCRGAQIRRRSLHPPVPGSGRPKPPRGSDAIERRIWNAVVDSLPDRWCDPSAQEVLRQAVAQAAVAGRLEQRLRKLRAQNLESPSDEEFSATVVAHREASKSATFLLSALRATPRSRATSREAKTAIERTPPTRPWLIKAKASA